MRIIYWARWTIRDTQNLEIATGDLSGTVLLPNPDAFGELTKDIVFKVWKSPEIQALIENHRKNSGISCIQSGVYLSQFQMLRWEP